MNVGCLYYDASANEEIAEKKIALHCKIAITSVLIWLCAWTSYAIVVMIGQFGNRSLITPLVSQVPSMFAKTCSCFNPIIYAIRHPKFREAVHKHLPCLGIKVSTKKNEDCKSVATIAA